MSLPSLVAASETKSLIDDASRGSGVAQDAGSDRPQVVERRLAYRFTFG
jgi:hypothetical protein